MTSKKAKKEGSVIREEERTAKELRNLDAASAKLKTEANKLDAEARKLVSCHTRSGASEFAMRVNARRGPQGISGIFARATTRFACEGSPSRTPAEGSGVHGDLPKGASREREGYPRMKTAACGRVAPLGNGADHSLRGRALPQTPWDALKRHNACDTTPEAEVRRFDQTVRTDAVKLGLAAFATILAALKVADTLGWI